MELIRDRKTENGENRGNVHKDSERQSLKGAEEAAGLSVGEQEEKTGIEPSAALDFRTALGIRILERGEGYAKGEMEVRETHLNPLGIIHGGCLFSLADTISGVAVMGHGRRVTTVNGNINFLRPGRAQGKVTAEAKEVKYGRTFSVCDCNIFDDKEKLIATTTMTFYHLP